MGVGFPMFSVAEVLPSGATLMASGTSPWLGGVLRDNTSVFSIAVGGEAGGGDSLSIMCEPSKFPEDDDCRGRSRAGLQYVIMCVRITRHKAGYLHYP